MFRQVFRGDVEGPRGKCLIDGNINAADPGPIHAYVRNQVPASVGDRNVHRLSNLCRLLLGGGYDVSCIIKCDHEISFNDLANADFANSYQAPSPPLIEQVRRHERMNRQRAEQAIRLELSCSQGYLGGASLPGSLRKIDSAA